MRLDWVGLGWVGWDQAELSDRDGVECCVISCGGVGWDCRVLLDTMPTILCQRLTWQQDVSPLVCKAYHAQIRVVPLLLFAWRAATLPSPLTQEVGWYPPAAQLAQLCEESSAVHTKAHPQLAKVIICRHP